MCGNRVEDEPGGEEESGEGQADIGYLAPQYSYTGGRRRNYMGGREREEMYDQCVRVCVCVRARACVNLILSYFFFHEAVFILRIPSLLFPILRLTSFPLSCLV